MSLERLFCCALKQAAAIRNTSAEPVPHLAYGLSELVLTPCEGIIALKNA